MAEDWEAAARSPREVAELVRRMVAGEDVGFGELFAEDAVFAYPFAAPGMGRPVAQKTRQHAASLPSAGHRQPGIRARRRRRYDDHG